MSQWISGRSKRQGAGLNGDQVNLGEKVVQWGSGKSVGDTVVHLGSGKIYWIRWLLGDLVILGNKMAHWRSGKAR